MKKVFLILVVGLLLVGVMGMAYAKNDKVDSTTVSSVSAAAVSDSSSDDSSDDSSDSDVKTNYGQDKKVTSSDSSDSEASDSGAKVKETQTITLMDQNQNRYQVTVRTDTKEGDGGEQVKIKVRDVEISSDVDVEQEGDLLKAKMSNGNSQEIKVMPDSASQVAIDNLQTKGLNVELKEVGEGNNLSVVYEAEGNKTVKFLGLFKVRAQVRATISAENGEVLRLDEPWWYFMAFGKGAVDCDADNLDLCDDEAECTVDAGLYWYDDVCNVEAEVVLECDADNLDLCLEEDCSLFNGTWDNVTSVCA